MNTAIAENQQFFNSLTPHTQSRCLSVDGDKCTLREFMQVNLIDEDVDHISLEDAQKICDMKLGDVVLIGTVSIMWLD